MNIKEKAKLFAIKAHKGQIRKSDKEKPMIIHPINVANILSEYGYDDNVVAAAYLHDVIEDTKYTKEDLLNEFNDDIVSLVLGATEEDKSLSWEERKTITIDKVKYLDLRHKAVVCADKISNLEDMRIIFEIKGEKDFSAFKRGFDKQKWYYTEVYNSLIYNEDKDYIMFSRLKLLIDDIFNDNKHDELERKIFEGREDEYNKLIRLHYRKQEIYKMISVLDKNNSYVIEFTGTPRTGKTTLMNNLYDFFKKGGFTTSTLEEFTTSKRYKKEIYPKLKDEYKEKMGYMVFGTKDHMLTYPFKLLANCFISVYYFIKIRPKYIVTTGTHTAGPICYLGKIFGSKIIYIETMANINRKTQTGRLIYPIADLFIVQWESMLKIYPKDNLKSLVFLKTLLHTCNQH